MVAVAIRRSLRVVIVCLAFFVPQVTSISPAAAASSWNLVDSHCFPFQYFSDGTYIHACWQLHKLTNDGSGTKDYFQLTYYATGGTFGDLGAKIHLMVLLAQPNASPAQQWVDWSPRSDWTGGSCVTYNAGISYAGASFSFFVDRCPELWDMTHFATPGKQQVAWSNPGGTTQDREVALGVVVKVNQGTTPGWAFGRGTD
jgi:hypothetical protein